MEEFIPLGRDSPAICDRPERKSWPRQIWGGAHGLVRGGRPEACHHAKPPLPLEGARLRSTIQGMIPLRHLLAPAAFVVTASLAAAALDTATIDSLTGLKGVWNDTEKVHKVSQPRNDLPISIDGWTMPPFMGLTSWAAFSEGGASEVMVAGDLVLLE